MEHERWLKDILLFLAAAGLVVPLFPRFRISAVLGFLLVGLLLGPYGLGRLAADHAWIRFVTIEDRARVDQVAELGILALLFLVGLELSFARLWALRRYVFGIGGVQVVASAAALGALAAAFGADGTAAVVLGLALAMSSTAIVMQLLGEQGRTATALGRVTLSVLLFQDLMVAPVLAVTGALAGEVERIPAALLQAVLRGAAAVAAILLLGRFVLRPLLQFTARTGSRDLIMAATVLILAGVAGLTHLAGLSAALGAFLAGLLIGETAYRHQIEIDIEPFKGLLLGLFFVSVGMMVDPRLVWNEIGVIALGVAILLVVKAAILLAAARLLGLGWATAAEVAVLLAQGGEFTFIVVGLARGNGILAPDLAQGVIACVGVTMLATPFLAWCARRLGERFARAEQSRYMPAEDADLADHVIIGGFGRVGQTVARLLDQERIPFVALEADGDLVAQHRAAGRPVYFGDAGRGEFLARAGAGRARAFVVTVNAPAAAERMVEAVLAQRPDAAVFARATDAVHARRLMRLGARGVVPEAVEASLQLGARVLESVGVPPEAAQGRIDRMRDEEWGRAPA